MARLTETQKEDLLADYHTGEYSNNELAKKYKTSHTTVNKMVKDLEPKHKEKVSTISAMRAELLQESFKEVSAVEAAINERTKHLLFFTNSALKNQTLANKKLNDNISMNDLEAHSRITSRNKDSVLGKEANTQVNIQNTNALQNNIVIEWE
jgi:predicted DNA-binding protein YlxM (UPF0122 family)